MIFPGHRRWSGYASFAVLLAALGVFLVATGTSTVTLAVVTAVATLGTLVTDGLRIELAVERHHVILSRRPVTVGGAKEIALPQIAAIEVLDRLPWRWRFSGWQYYRGRKWAVRWDRTLLIALVGGETLVVTVDDPEAARAAILEGARSIPPAPPDQAFGPVDPDRRWYDAP